MSRFEHMLYLKKHFHELIFGSLNTKFSKISFLIRILFIGLPIVLILRILRPLLLIRIGRIISSRIGHFASNTELYLCEQEAGINIPNKAYFDIFYLAGRPVCNEYLGNLWRRKLRIYPHCLMEPIDFLNSVLPGGTVNEVGNNSMGARDVNNLLEFSKPHLEFSQAEEDFGKRELIRLGIPEGAEFICLIVRDSSYLDVIKSNDWSYHDYRDCNIDNFNYVCKKLITLGYYVVRMGVKVKKSLDIEDIKIIDYAYKNLRTEFLDIYLGAKCKFCITTSTGWDDIPEIFRRPIVGVNIVPIAGTATYRSTELVIFKKFIDDRSNKVLSLLEILDQGYGYFYKTQDYKDKNITLIENSPEEICDVVLEMLDRLNGSFREDQNDKNRQEIFWNYFLSKGLDKYQGKKMHGELRSSIGQKYLKTFLKE